MSSFLRFKVSGKAGAAKARAVIKEMKIKRNFPFCTCTTGMGVRTSSF